MFHELTEPKPQSVTWMVSKKGKKAVNDKLFRTYKIGLAQSTRNELRFGTSPARVLDFD